MGMVPVGGWETQKGSEHSAHGARQLFAREAYNATVVEKFHFSKPTHQISLMSIRWVGKDQGPAGLCIRR